MAALCGVWGGRHVQAKATPPAEGPKLAELVAYIDTVIDRIHATGEDTNGSIVQRGQASVVRNIGPDAAADEEGQHCRLTAEGGVMHRTAESQKRVCKTPTDACS